MWPYILLIILPFLIQHIRISYSVTKDDSTSYTKLNSRAMVIFWIILFLMLIFRHETIGNDTKNYSYIFKEIAHSSWSKSVGRSVEIGYTLLNKIVALFTTDFRWLLVITSLLSICFVARAYIKYSDDTILTISLFITMSNFVLLFSGIRQAIAISLGFLAFECVKARKIIIFFVVVIIAMLFHTSAFMLVFMYPLYYARMTKKWLLAIVPILAMVFIFNKQIFGVLSVILMNFTKYDAEISSTGAGTMLIVFIAFFAFSYIVPEETNLDEETVGLRNFLIFSVALQMLAPLHSLAMRMNYYYIAFIPLLIPRVVKYRSERWEQVASLARYIMIFFFVIYFFITAPQDNVLHTFPYRFFWETR